MHAQLETLLATGGLHTHFQPILGLRKQAYVGYEALTRGPSGSTLQAPAHLFQIARNAGCLQAVEQLAVETTLAAFAHLKRPGKLFLNVSPEGLLNSGFSASAMLGHLARHGIPPKRVVIEITESSPTYDYAPLSDVVRAYRDAGMEVALDDLGEGFSSLRLWSEIKPDYIKVDKHFVQNIHLDPVKLQFLRSIQAMAENSGARVVAEGIETRSEFLVIRELGLSFGQGHFIARPEARPRSRPGAEVLSCLDNRSREGAAAPSIAKLRASRLLIAAPAVSPETSSLEVLDMFLRDTQLHAIPVVDQGTPVGMINRWAMVDHFSRVFTRELFGKKPCTHYMDPEPLIADKGTTLEDLSLQVVEKGRQSLTDGFILTENGLYLGIGSGFELMREITQMQIAAARYANPLSSLPGNVPISETAERWLSARTAFTACYCDLDNFKPFNDLYGYRRGDELILFVARILSEICDSERDFAGHIGGDDFLLLFQSEDWDARCRNALLRFDAELGTLIDPEHLKANGFYAEDRRGNQVFHPLPALSIGAVAIDPYAFDSHHEVAAAATEAKRQAKKSQGSSLFIEQRRYPTGTGTLFDSLPEPQRVA